MKKRLMALVLLPLMAAADVETVDGIEWTYSIADGEAIIQSGSRNVSAIPNDTAGAIEVPLFLGGCPVAAVGDYAFWGCVSLTSVVIPHGVRNIGTFAFFNCRGMTSVAMPASVTYVGYGAFMDCRGLIKVTIPSCIQYMSMTFPQASNKIREVIICEGVTDIHRNVFDCCTSMVSVKMPSSVTSIGEYAFQSCFALASVVIPEGVKSIGANAFNSCSSLTAVTIPSSVESIGEWAFQWCINLRTVYVDAGDASRVKGLLANSGFDVDRVRFMGRTSTIGVVLEGDTDGCKVTGTGAYLVGKTVTLKVTTKKGTAFAGFYRDGEPWPNESDYKKTSLAYTMSKDDVSLVAKFEKEKMSVGCVGLSDCFFTAGVAGSPEGIPLEIETQSGVKSVKVEKLPAGMKFGAKNKLITGAPTKAGDNKVVITVTAVSGAVEKKEIAVPVAAMSETAVGTFNGFVANGEQRIGTFTLKTTDAGKLTAKVITAGGTVSFSGTCWDSLEDGVYKVTLTTKKGERLSLTLDSNATWDANQLSGTFTTALILAKGKSAEIPSRTYSVSAQRNAFGKTWYFTAVGDERTGWTFAYTKDAKAAALTVTLKADGSTAIAGKLPNGVDAKGKAVSLKVSASGYANVGWMRDGAIIADFAPIVTANKVKRVLSIHANLWFDRLNDHDEGAGSAQMVK